MDDGELVTRLERIEAWAQDMDERLGRLCEVIVGQATIGATLTVEPQVSFRRETEPVHDS